MATSGIPITAGKAAELQGALMLVLPSREAPQRDRCTLGGRMHAHR
jgi:hypothetical protein